MTFGERLKELRNNRGLKQNELADKLNMSQATVGSWENGTRDPSTKMIVSIAEYFKVSTDYLLGHEITSNPLLDEYLRREFVPRFNNLKAGLEAILYNKDSDKSDDKSDV